jgi:hypothetical protein
MIRKRFVLTVGRILTAMAIAIAAAPGFWAFQSITEYEFQGVPDGSQPGGGLVSDGSGNFYRTTEGSGFSAPFCGTVFKLSSGKTEFGKRPRFTNSEEALMARLRKAL